MTAKETARLAIAEQATEWYVHHREGSLDDAARQEFQAWLLESPTHVEEYLAVTRLIALLPEAGQDADFAVDRLVSRARADKVADFDFGAPARSARVPRTAVQYAFGARLGLVAASLLILLVGGMVWWNSWQARVTSFNYATAHGIVKAIALPDRSLLQLDSDSSVTVRYGHGVRQVELLRGQAYIEVTPDPVRQFEVVVGAVHVRDVGTHFDVYRREPLVEVTILQGAVSVESASGSAIARAGQQATVSLGGGAVSLQDVDTEEAVAWRSGRLVFRQRPLLEVVDAFNRYSQVRIEIDTPGLEIMPVSGAISVRDITSFMAFLNNLPGVKVTAATGYISVTRDN
jgi:transmembrane sensor